MRRMWLASGLLRRGSSLLLVRGVYAGQRDPLWTLPGGQQDAGETLAQALVREFREETSLEVEPDNLAYVSESVDQARNVHVLNCTFWVSEADATIQPKSNDAKVVEVRFVPETDAPKLLGADVLRIPVAAALAAYQDVRYFTFNAQDIVVPFFR
jgi:8-oxo-dGTP diphosphatase